MTDQAHYTLALNAFNGKHNCAQAVVLAFANRFNIDEAICLRVASGFGGGIAMSGAMCGALTGGIMVLGLAGTGKDESKTKTYENSKLLMTCFEQKFGSKACKLLTESKSEFDTKSFCDKFVREAAIMVEEILEKKING